MKIKKIRLFEISQKSNRRSYKEIEIKKEITPPWKDLPPIFEHLNFVGYPTLFHALTICSTLENIGLILNVGSKDTITNSPYFYSNYLVFETKEKKFSYDRSKKHLEFGPFELPTQVIGMRLVNVYSRKNYGKWGVDTIKIFDPTRAKDLMMNFMDLKEDEIQIIYENDDFAKGMLAKSKEVRHKTANRYFRESRINFNQYLKNVNGRTYSINIESYSRKASEFRDPKVYISISPKPFLKEPHPIIFMATLVHESLHAIGNLRIIHIINIWKNSGSRKNFFKWMIDYSHGKKKELEITNLDFVLTLVSCRPFSEKEKILLYKIVGNLGFPKTNYDQAIDILEILSYLEAFKFKIWLVEENELVKNEIYLMDLNKINKKYLSTKNIKFSRSLTDSVINFIMVMLEKLQGNKKEIVLNYIKKTIETEDRLNPVDFFRLMQNKINHK